jgi:hypothetical protein
VSAQIGNSSTLIGDTGLGYSGALALAKGMVTVVVALLIQILHERRDHITIKNFKIGTTMRERKAQSLVAGQDKSSRQIRMLK